MPIEVAHSPDMKQHLSISYRLVFIVLTLSGILLAIRQTWVADDAFISFRYVLQWLRGNGLVFNPGEHVEGYTNFLWVVLLAPWELAQIDLRLAAAIMSILAFGILSMVMFLVGGRLFRIDADRTTTDGHAAQSDLWRLFMYWPLCVPVLALHHHMRIFATSGLETMLFTLLVTAGALLFVLHLLAHKQWAMHLAFVLLALSALTRPEGYLFYTLSLGYVAMDWLWRRRVPELERSHFLKLASLLLCAALPLLLICGPHILFRFWYYGDWVPNTFYAKSAYDSYWSQGLRYALLYLQSYWLIPVLIVLLAVLRLIVRRRNPDGNQSVGTPQKAVRYLWLLILCYCAYVIRVGGDFMFARFWIPITPILFFALEWDFRRVWRQITINASDETGVEVPTDQPTAIMTSQAPDSRNAIAIPNRWGGLVGLVLLSAAVSVLRFDPYQGLPFPEKWGISEEYRIYTPERVSELRQLALDLKPTFKAAGPILAFVGAQAGLIYYLDPRVAIEAETGLTDRNIARRTLEQRGRVGHEKQASYAYLKARGVHILLRAPPADRAATARTVRIQGLPGDLEIIQFDARVFDILQNDPRIDIDL